MTYSVPSTERLLNAKHFSRLPPKSVARQKALWQDTLREGSVRALCQVREYNSSGLTCHLKRSSPRPQFYRQPAFVAETAANLPETSSRGRRERGSRRRELRRNPPLAQWNSGAPPRSAPATAARTCFRVRGQSRIATKESSSGITKKNMASASPQRNAASMPASERSDPLTSESRSECRVRSRISEGDWTCAGRRLRGLRHRRRKSGWLQRGS